MSSLSLRLPDSLHRKIRQLADQDDISINQFIATAVAEKAAALLTVEYLEERGRRADPELVDRILSRVPDVRAPVRVGRRDRERAFAAEAPFERVEFSHAALPAHADHLIAPIQRVLEHVLPEFPPTPRRCTPSPCAPIGALD